MIVGETRMIADTSGHTKPLRYFETTFARVHRQNILDSGCRDRDAVVERSRS